MDLLPHLSVIPCQQPERPALPCPLQSLPHGCQQLLDDVRRPLLDVKLEDHAALLQLAQIGMQAAQPEGRVNVAGVECG